MSRTRMAISSALVGVRPPNDEMQRTRHGNAAASPLISVFYGSPASRASGQRHREWVKRPGLAQKESVGQGPCRACALVRIGLVQQQRRAEEANVPRALSSGRHEA